ncbi:unnamed protein product [Cylindrotheca closterium]|uniref:DUF6824 domain-containing protein n=1 Tax=Cylindrotheca closterium TaxID=2856 RepID=A0AAD2PXN4_9STRA|nr:unnamed protein product [Cylindrotheca closterium]
MLIEHSMKVPTERAVDDIKLSGIPEPHDNDVLMGRGGKNNQHVGNEQLRSLARGRSMDYQNASKKGKSSISRELVRIVREMKPPGRFLRKDTETNKWEDVGNDIAREKTSQVLRDAVALHSDPSSSTGNGPNIESNPAFAARNDTSFQRHQATAEDERDYSAAVMSSGPREIRSPNYYHVRHPYVNITPQSVPYHLPVTPASSEARKRPRYYESPLPSYHNTPNYLNTPSHPLGVMLSPPPRNEAHRPPAYSSYYAGQSGHRGTSIRTLPLSQHQPPQTTARSQYVPSNEPVDLDSAENMDSAENTDPLPIDASTSGHTDFDLFNGELLSDFTYPEI